MPVLRRPSVPLVAAVLVAAGLAVPQAARAHGGLPQSVGVVFEDPADPVPLVLTSFGVLVPEADGRWAWVCEDVVGTGGLSAFEALPTGRWLMGTTRGLWASDDRCAWNEVGGDARGLFFTQVTRDPDDPTRVYAGTASDGGANYLWASEDSGDTFLPFADFGPGTGVRGFGIAPGGGPFWVVGWRADDLGGDPTSTPFLAWSESGATWESHDVPKRDGEVVHPSVTLLGLDPADDESAWLRVHVADQGYDVLVRAGRDGTFTEVPIGANGVLYDDLVAFAAGPDPGRLEVGGRNEGLYVSIDGGETWSGPSVAPEAGCLVDHDGLRYRCTNAYADGASVVASPPGTSSFQDVQRFDDVCHPYACPAGTEAAEVCGPLWDEVSQSAGLCPLGEDPPGDDDTADGGGCEGCTAGRGGAPVGKGWPAAPLAAIGLAAAGRSRTRRGRGRPPA